MENRPKARSLLDFERPKLDASLYQENTSPHGFGMNPTDGLPTPVSSATFQDTEAPDLLPDRFVCMEARDASGNVVRKSCENYKRQLLPSSDKQRVICLRYCTALREEGGELYDLGNQELLACELRSPRDPLSEEKLHAFDTETMRRQEERRKEQEPFDPLKALEEQGR